MSGSEREIIMTKGGKRRGNEKGGGRRKSERMNEKI